MSHLEWRWFNAFLLSTTSLLLLLPSLFPPPSLPPPSSSSSLPSSLPLPYHLPPPPPPSLFPPFHIFFPPISLSSHLARSSSSSPEIAKTQLTESQSPTQVPPAQDSPTQVPPAQDPPTQPPTTSQKAPGETQIKGDQSPESDEWVVLESHDL